MNPYSSLSEAERFRQIEILVASAVARYWRDEWLAGGGATTPGPAIEVSDLVSDEIEKQVLRYLTQQVSASPARMAVSLGIAHSTLVRRLARLRAGGLVVVIGKTKGTRYELASLQMRN